MVLGRWLTRFRRWLPRNQANDPALPVLVDDPHPALCQKLLIQFFEHVIMLRLQPGPRAPARRKALITPVATGT